MFHCIHYNKEREFKWFKWVKICWLTLQAEALIISLNNFNCVLALQAGSTGFIQGESEKSYFYSNIILTVIGRSPCRFFQNLLSNSLILTRYIWSFLLGPRPPAAEDHTGWWWCSQWRNPEVWELHSCQSCRLLTFHTETYTTLLL